MEEISLINLPKDIIKKLLNEYFPIYAPNEAIKCMRLCKLTLHLSNKDSIIKQSLKTQIRQEYLEYRSTFIVCPKCETRLETEIALKKHLQKHVELERKGKQMPNVKKIKTVHCPHCDEDVAPSHLCGVCCLRIRTCFNDAIQHMYKWIDVLCPQTEWLNGDPKFHNHVCTARCKVCKHEFESGYDPNDDYWEAGVNEHFEDCPMRKEMIEIYRLKGDRTDDEWDSFLLETRDQPNERKIEFENQYVEWKLSLTSKNDIQNEN